MITETPDDAWVQGCFPDFGCALGVSKTLGEGGLKSCADLLVVYIFL